MQHLFCMEKKKILKINVFNKHLVKRYLLTKKRIKKGTFFRFKKGLFPGPRLKKKTEKPLLGCFLRNNAVHKRPQKIDVFEKKGTVSNKFNYPSWKKGPGEPSNHVLKC